MRVQKSIPPWTHWKVPLSAPREIAIFPFLFSCTKGVFCYAKLAWQATLEPRINSRNWRIDPSPPLFTRRRSDETSKRGFCASRKKKRFPSPLYNFFLRKTFGTSSFFRQSVMWGFVVGTFWPFKPFSFADSAFDEEGIFFSLLFDMWENQTCHFFFRISHASQTSFQSN